MAVLPVVVSTVVVAGCLTRHCSVTLPPETAFTFTCSKHDTQLAYQQHGGTRVLYLKDAIAVNRLDVRHTQASTLSA